MRSTLSSRQTDATQVAILIPEMNRLLRLFMAKFVLMRVIKSATDLTKVFFSDMSVQLDDDILAVGMAMRTMLADSDDDLADSTRTRIFKSVRHFYVAIVEKMKTFPFHDTVLKDISVESRPQVARHMESNDGEEFGHSFQHCGIW